MLKSNVLENFFFFFELSVFWHIYRPYPFHPRVTTVGRKRSRPLCQRKGCKLQLNSEVPYLCGFERSDTKQVHGWKVYAELAPRRQQFHVAPTTQHPNSHVSTPLRWLLESALWKKESTVICSREENSAINVTAINNNNAKCSVWLPGEGGSRASTPETQWSENFRSWQSIHIFDKPKPSCLQTLAKLTPSLPWCHLKTTNKSAKL